jgi:hypothetical protein
MINDAVHKEITGFENNASWTYFRDWKTIVYIYATRDIHADEEVFIEYGYTYWVKKNMWFSSSSLIKAACALSNITGNYVGMIDNRSSEEIKRNEYKTRFENITKNECPICRIKHDISFLKIRAERKSLYLLCISTDTAYRIVNRRGNYSVVRKRQMNKNTGLGPILARPLRRRNVQSIPIK